MASQLHPFCASKRVGSSSQKKENYSAHVHERLQWFTEYLVTEFETKVHLEHMVLEGELKKAGKYSETYSKKAAKAVGAGITALLPGGTAFLGLGASAGEALIDPILSSKGEKYHERRIVPLAQLIYSSVKNKSSLRRTLVEASYDLFQSFEMQFMRVTTDAGYQPAMKILARDATNRALDYLRKNDQWDQVSLTEAIILGNSKIEPTLTLPTPEVVRKTPGLKVKYVYNGSEDTWHTASLYEKVGLVVENKTRNDYFDKDGSKTKKYGYRRLLKSEKWEDLREDYNKSSDLTEKMEFADYQYVLSLDALEKQSEYILEKINEDDPNLAESRIREMLGEVQRDLLEAINSLKIEILDDQYRQIISHVRENLQLFKMEEYITLFKEAKQTGQELKEMVQSGFQSNSQQLDKIVTLVSSCAEDASLISNLPNFSVYKIVKRTKKIDEIKKVLKHNKYLVIFGESGSGKSTIAVEYGLDVWINKSSNKKVRFVSADSFAKINAEYRLLAEELQLNITSQTEDGIMRLVHRRIEHSGYYVLFIFDNVGKYEDVEPYIASLADMNNIKVIITTTDICLSHASHLRSIKLDLFTRDEAKSFIEENAPKNTFKEAEIECLLDHFCSDVFVLPYSIKCALMHFKQEPSTTVESYIKDLKEIDDSTGAFVIFNSLKKSEILWRVLQYSAYLDPDFISSNIIKHLLSLSIDDEEGKKDLDNALVKLENLSLMKTVTRKNGGSGLKILHRLTQDSVIKYANANKHLENIIDKITICEKIIKVLETLFSSIIRHPQEDWRFRVSLYLHAIKLLHDIEHDEEVLCKINKSLMSSLYHKLGYYSVHVSRNFDLALFYYRKALNVLISIFFKDNPSMFHSLTDIDKIIEYIETCQTNFTLSEISILREFVDLFESYGDAYIEMNESYKAIKYHEYAFMVRNALHRRQFSPTLTGNKFKVFSDTPNGDIYIVLNHLEVARSFNKFGSKLVQLRYPHKAVEILDFALEMEFDLDRDSDHPDIATSLAHIDLEKRKEYNEDFETQKLGFSLQRETHKSKDVYQRLQTFTKYFVKEFETKIQLYHMILSRSNFAGILSENYAGPMGKASGGLIAFLSAGAFPMVFNYGGIEETLGKDKFNALALLVYSCETDKAAVRRSLVEAACDLFQSYELQFMRVTTDKGYKTAMRKLAKDATNRAIDYLGKKQTENKLWSQVRITEAIIHGNSKIELKFFHSRLGRKKAGFEVKYVYNDSEATWHTASLYEKVGLVVENKNRNDYFEKDGSKTRKYGYRRPLKSENWDYLKKVYNISSGLTKSEQFTNYEYMLGLEALKKQSGYIIEEINHQDGLAESRIIEMVGKVKEDLAEAKNSLKVASLGSNLKKQSDGILNEINSDDLMGSGIEKHVKETMESSNKSNKNEMEETLTRKFRWPGLQNTNGSNVRDKLPQFKVERHNNHFEETKLRCLEINPVVQGFQNNSENNTQFRIEDLEGQNREKFTSMSDNLPRTKIEKYIKNVEKEAKQERQELKEMIQSLSRKFEELATLVSSSIENTSITNLSHS